MIRALARLGGLEPGELPKSFEASGISGKNGISAMFASHPRSRPASQPCSTPAWADRPFGPPAKTRPARRVLHEPTCAADQSRVRTVAPVVLRPASAVCASPAWARL